MGSFKFKDVFVVCYCQSINHRVFFAPSYSSQYKKKRKLFNDFFWGGEIIYCKNDFISVALPFNKELCSKDLS